MHKELYEEIHDIILDAVEYSGGYKNQSYYRWVAQILAAIERDHNAKPTPEA